MNADDPRVLSVTCIISPGEISNRCSLKIPMAVSMNVQSKKPNNSFSFAVSHSKDLEMSAPWILQTALERFADKE